MSKTRHRGSTGGSASSGGAKYGASVAAWLSVRMLLGARASLPWRLPQGTFIRSLWCESATEVDDLVIDCIPGAKIFLQMKHGLTVGPEFDKAIAQLARQYISKSFNDSTDRLVIVTDPSASGTIRIELAESLKWFHDLPASTPLTSFPYPDKSKKILARVKSIFEKETTHTGKAVSEIDWRNFLKTVHLTVADPMDGAEKNFCIEQLQTLMGADTGASAWHSISEMCLDAGRLRQPLDAVSMELRLSRNGISVSIYNHSRFATLTSLAKKFNENQSAIPATRRVFDHCEYVERKRLDDKLNELLRDDHHILIISGASGRGKTTWCAAQTKNHNESVRILLPSEYISTEDNHLRDTIHRQLNLVARDHHLNCFSAAEVLSWFSSAPLLIFVDGLDRAIIKKYQLLHWLRNTAGEVEGTACRIVITTRPEILDAVKFELKSTAENIGLSEFSEFEALEAARKIGIPALAKYRHPQMMSFCAALWNKKNQDFLHRREVVAEFINEIAGTIALENDQLVDFINNALEDLGKILASSPDCLIDPCALQNFQRMHGSTYEALRRGNFIAIHQNTGRIEVDEIAEHLAGKWTNIKENLDNWEEIKQISLKVGALRSALEQLVAKDPDSARPFIDQIADSYFLEPSNTRLSLICSVISAHSNLTPLYELTLNLALSWKKSNMFLFWGAGLEFINLLKDARWPFNQRIKLMWEIAKRESGYDWREKHWLTPDYAPNFSVTEWRRYFLDVLHSSKEEGLRFLLDHFDSDVPFKDTRESQLGDLARGCFFLTASHDMNTAIKLLAASQTNSAEQMIRMLAREHPALAHEVVFNDANHLSHNTKVDMAEAMSQSTPPFPGTCKLAQHLLDTGESLPHQIQQLLRILIKGGNTEAAEDLIINYTLNGQDLHAFYGLPVDDFTKAVAKVFSINSASEAALQGLIYTDLSTEYAAPLVNIVIQASTRLTPKILGRITEAIVYAAQNSQKPFDRLYELVNIVLNLDCADARRNLVYCAARHGGIKTTYGQEVQRHLLQRIMEVEKNPESVCLLAQRLVENYSADKFIQQYLCDLALARPNTFEFDEFLLPSEEARLLAEKLISINWVC